MSSHFMFENMKFTDEHNKLKDWFPLIMKDRTPDEVMAATRMELGTGVNFGSLTNQYFKILEEQFEVPVLRSQEVLDIDLDGPEDWSAKIEERNTGEISYYEAEHIFIGPGGGALPLLQKVEIPEKDGYGGCPVSGSGYSAKTEKL